MGFGNLDFRDLVLFNTVEEIIEQYPVCRDFFANHNLEHLPKNKTAADVFSDACEEDLAEFGFSKVHAVDHLVAFLEAMEKDITLPEEIHSLTILGGKNKSGYPEQREFHIKKGEIVSIVGPTGSGKSRLLADIECLAQGDTPTGRCILINGKKPDPQERLAMEGKLIAQLSQNMNFIMDIRVLDFLQMHAKSRSCQNIEQIISKCFAHANALAGEPFQMQTKITQLSGGQSRALMIADTAFISNSPVLLIDEIENAGIDRKAAVKLLSENGKIVLISTHDPVLTLSAQKRIVIKDGGIHKVLETTLEERSLLPQLEDMDNLLLTIRGRLRQGESVTL